jgi:LAS superfamily LD-carboxypeptidase LdcB
MKTFLTFIIEKDLLVPAILSTAMAISPGDGEKKPKTPPTPTISETKPEEKKTKTVTAQEFAATNAEKNGVLTSDDLVMVGKLKNPTPWNDNYGPKPWYFGNAYLHPQAASSFKTMDDAYFQETGKRISINSAYRSREQQRMFGGKYSVAAQPGKSRHGLGLAMDVQPGTPEFDWMKKNGSKYGWQWMNIKNDACHFGYCGNIEVPVN